MSVHTNWTVCDGADCKINALVCVHNGGLSRGTSVKYGPGNTKTHKRAFALPTVIHVSTHQALITRLLSTTFWFAVIAMLILFAVRNSFLPSSVIFLRRICPLHRSHIVETLSLCCWPFCQTTAAIYTVRELGWTRR